jgi:hypothetical protein
MSFAEYASHDGVGLAALIPGTQYLIDSGHCHRKSGQKPNDAAK